VEVLGGCKNSCPDDIKLRYNVGVLKILLKLFVIMSI